MRCFIRFGVWFSLFSAIVKVPHAQVVVKQVRKGTAWHLSNAYGGIIIAGDAGFVDKEGKMLAPIQAVVYADGAISDTTPNYLLTEAKGMSGKLSWLSRNADSVVVKIEYAINRQAVKSSSGILKGGESGLGYYSSVVKVYKNAKSILVEEDANSDIRYFISIGHGLNPDEGRYRGWNSSEIETGFESPGKIYRSEDERGYPMDATVRLSPKLLPRFTKLYLWDPAGGEGNSGRYWMFYNSSGEKNANLLGIYQGRPSRLIGAKFSGVQIYRRAEDARQTELSVFIERQGADDTWFPRKRFEWRLFVSRKIDLLPALQVQPINVDMNKYSLLGNRIDGYFEKEGSLSEAFYSAAIYMDPASIKKTIRGIKSDMNRFNLACQIDPYYTDIFFSWKSGDSAKLLIERILAIGNDIQSSFKTGEGPYKAEYRYWKGAILFKQIALKISCLLGDETLKIDSDKRKKLVSLVKAMARIVWDDDNVPCQDSSGVNYGPANMYYQYQNNARSFFALLLKDDPEFEKRARGVADRVRSDLYSVIYRNGSTIAVPMYTQPALDPILFSMLQLKQSGLADLFSEESRISGFVEFYKSLLTPRSVKYGGNRKLISFGDGSEQGAATFALLASGVSDTSLKSELNSIYFNGPPRMTPAGSLTMAVDLPSSAVKNVKIVSSRFKGYMSHFRSGLNSNLESAIWLFDGDSVYDHRNDDAGEVSAYALGCPLIMNRNCVYSPSATDARIRSVVVPFEMFKNWNGNDQPIGERSLTNRTWKTSESIAFSDLNNFGSTTAFMSNGSRTWTRQITFISLEKEVPLLIFYDSTGGTGAAIWSLPFASEGRIMHNSRQVELARRRHNNGDKKELPNAGYSAKMQKGVNSLFFSGQKWDTRLHPTGGIDWNVFVNASVGDELSFSEWENFWQNDAEMREFEAVNKRKYSEVQQFVRWKSNKPFRALVVPFLKGSKVPVLQVEFEENGETYFKTDQYRYYVSRDYVRVVGKEKNFYAFFSSIPVKIGDLSNVGGPSEIEVTEGEISISVSDIGSERKITLPGAWLISERVDFAEISTTEKSTVVRFPGKSAPAKNVQKPEGSFKLRLVKK